MFSTMNLSKNSIEKNLNEKNQLDENFIILS